MAKELTFSLNGKLFKSVPVKLEREKIYGKSVVEAFDRQGHLCTAAGLDAGGTLIVPSGALKPVQTDGEGLWVEKSQLQAVDEEGHPLTAVPSSFDGEIPLEKTVTEEQFLDHIWKSVYQLLEPELAAAVGDRIYAFDFSYRGGTGYDEGYLLAVQNRLYLFAGEPVDFPFISISEEGVTEENGDSGESEDICDLDFDMM